MSLRKIFFVICLIITVLCLATGYAIAGQWIGAMIVLLTTPAWWLARKYPASRLPLACLLVSICFAVLGILINSPPLLMILGSAASLAGWDLVLLDSALGKNSSLVQTRQYENRHIQSLMLALGSGLLATLLGHLINVQIPFIVLMLFIAFILFSLDRVWGYLKKTGKP